MATWPVTLPVNPLAESFNPVPPVLLRRTEFDAGAAFQRRLATDAPWTFAGLRFVVDATQLTAFQTFWTDDISSGADAFDYPVPSNWPVPGAGTTKTFRITSEYGLVPRARGSHWLLQLDMEMLP